MSEVDEIEKIKKVALETVNPETKKKSIDALAAYGSSAIPAITEIADTTLAPNTKQYALDAIKKIKERRT